MLHFQFSILMKFVGKISEKSKMENIIFSIWRCAETVPTLQTIIFEISQIYQKEVDRYGQIWRPPPLMGRPVQ